MYSGLCLHQKKQNYPGLLKGGRNFESLFSASVINWPKTVADSNLGELQ